MLILFTSGVLAQQLEETLYRLPKGCRRYSTSGNRPVLARGALQALGDFHGIFPAALSGAAGATPMARLRDKSVPARHRNVPRLRQMRARAVGDHIKTGMQPEVDLYA